MRGLGLLSLALVAAIIGAGDAHACPSPVGDAFPRGGVLPAGGSIYVLGYHGLAPDMLSIRLREPSRPDEEGRPVSFRAELLDGCDTDLWRLTPETAFEADRTYALVPAEEGQLDGARVMGGQFRAGRRAGSVPEAPDVAEIEALEETLLYPGPRFWPRIVLDSPSPEVAYYAIWSVPAWGRIDYGTPPAARQFVGASMFVEEAGGLDWSIDLECLGKQSRLYAQRFGIRAVGYDGQMGPATEYLWDPNDELLGVWAEPWQVRPWRTRPWFWKAFGVALVLDVTMLFLLGRRRRGQRRG